MSTCTQDDVNNMQLSTLISLTVFINGVLDQCFGGRCLRLDDTLEGHGIPVKVKGFQTGLQTLHLCQSVVLCHRQPQDRIQLSITSCRLSIFQDKILEKDTS